MPHENIGNTHNQTTQKTYCRLRPHLDFVLSEIKPINGSVMESKARGAKNITDHIQPGNPKSWTKTTINMLIIAGNI